MPLALKLRPAILQIGKECSIARLLNSIVFVFEWCNHAVSCMRDHIVSGFEFIRFKRRLVGLSLSLTRLMMICPPALEILSMSLRCGKE